MNRICFVICSFAVLFISQENISAKNFIHQSNLAFQKDSVIDNFVGSTPYIIVEEMPVFDEKATKEEKDRLVDFRKYINDRVVYPANAKKNRKTITVFVQFDVDEQGEVVDVKIIRGAGPAFDAEAIRVVSSSPRWTPGRHRGKEVRVRFTVPVEFKQL